MKLFTVFKITMTNYERNITSNKIKLHSNFMFKRKKIITTIIIFI